VNPNEQILFEEKAFNFLYFLACLKLQKLPFRVQWIEYPDIEAFCQSNGIQPTGSRGGGFVIQIVCLPMILDPKTAVYLAESTGIAEYLDRTYLETPPVFPSNTLGLQRILLGKRPFEPLWRFVVLLYLIVRAKRTFDELKDVIRVW